jgi:hypothetical protein
VLVVAELRLCVAGVLCYFTWFSGDAALRPEVETLLWAARKSVEAAARAFIQLEDALRMTEVAVPMYPVQQAALMVGVQVHGYLLRTHLSTCVVLMLFAGGVRCCSVRKLTSRTRWA